MPAYFPFLLVAHIILAISLVLPSILLPFALRTRRATVESENGVVQALLWAQTHGTIAIGLGLALTGIGLDRDARLDDAPAAVAAAGPRDLLRQPRHRVLHPATEPAPARSASAPPPTTRPGSSGRKRQRYVSYLMAGLVGTIGFLMSSKPVLW